MNWAGRVNPFQPKADQIPGFYMECLNANQVIGFYMKCNTRPK